jgi:methylaspartate ammonia-lyase
MRIENVLSCITMAGYYNKDLAAIKAGAEPNGFVFRSDPITPGFDRITQPGEAVSIMLILGDGQVAFGDCFDVVFAGAAGRDRVFRAVEHLDVIRGELTDFLKGQSVDVFRELAGSVEQMKVHGKRLHTAVRYGVSQALLDATAKARHVTMAEVIQSEYGCRMSDHPIPMLACTTNEARLNIDKMILKKVPYLPHGSSSNVTRDLGNGGEKLIEYASWLSGRILSLREPDYNPTIHLDVYGTIGELFDLQISEIAQFMGRLSDVCKPFPLMVETPIIAESREKQVALYKELSGLLRNRSISVKIIVDEWCNTLEDIELFAREKAADLIQIKTPDLGGIHNSVEAVLTCKKMGVAAYLGGTVNGTDQSAKVSAHVALATGAEFLLAKPGQGVDEGLMIEYNEMQRTLALAHHRSQKQGSHGQQFSD